MPRPAERGRVELQWKKILILISLLSNDRYHKEECPAIA